MNVAKKLNKNRFLSFLILSLFFVFVLICSYFIFIDKSVKTTDTDKDLEFVYMESSNLSLGQSQNVYVSCYNSDYANNLSLTYHKLGEETITLSPSNVIDEVALFSIPFGNEFQVGKYTLDNVSWNTEDAGSQALDNEKGYSFEVNNNPIVEDELPAGIYDISGTGELTEANLLDSSKTQMLLSKEASDSSIASNGLKICLDPGHGGSDSGACYGRLQEKWVNLNIADACKERLQSNGFQVVMTRDSDIDVGLEERCLIAKNNGCNLFVSFHNNSGGAVGSEVWVQYDGCTWHDEFAYIGSDIARIILERLHNTFGLTNRGAKDAIWNGRSYPGGSPGDYYAVLYYSRLYEIPGILIEHAFMDGDYNFLCDNNNLIQMGYQDAEAIIQYYGNKPYPLVKEMKNGSLTLKWNKVKGATKYAIYRYDGSKYIPYSEDYKENEYVISGLTNGEYYEFLVQAFVNGKWTSFTKNDHLATRLLPCPDPVNCTYTGDGEVEFAWSKLPNASKYAIAEYKNGGYVTYSTEIKSESDIVKYKVENLSCGVEHKFLIQAWFCDKWWSWYDDSCLISCVPEGPIKPINIEIKPNTWDAVISWDNVPGAINYNIAVQRLDGSYANHFTNSTNNSYILKDLGASREYTLAVQSCNFINQWSTIASSDLYKFTTNRDPDIPLVVAKGGNGKVDLAWEAVDGASKYAVYRVIGNSYISYTETLKENSYNISNLPNNEEYTFLVQSYTLRGWSNFSPQDYVRAKTEGPIKPTIKSAVPGSRSIELSWDSIPGASRYAIATKNIDGSYKTYSTVCTSNSYIINGLIEGHEYDCLVQCMLNGRWSSFDSSDLYTVSTVDTRPVPHASWHEGDDGIINITWDEVENAKNYAIYEVMPTGSFRALNESLSSNKYQALDLANDYSHTFLVQAFVGGSWSSISPSLYTSATPHGHTKPFGFSSVSGSNSISLSWTRVPGAQKYAIATRNDDGSFRTYSLNCTNESFVINGLSIAHEYQVLVQVMLGGRWSSFTSDDLLTISTIDTRPVPTANFVGEDGELEINWDPVDNAQRYAIYEVTNAGGFRALNENWTQCKFIANNLANFYLHTFLVQAFVGGSWSPISPQLYCSGTPEGHVKPWKVIATSELMTISLTWNHVPGAEKYAIATKVNGGGFVTHTYNCLAENFTITNLRIRGSYQCLVQAYINGLWSTFTDDDLVSINVTDNRPIIDKNSPMGDGSVLLKWNKIESSEKYAVYEVINGKFVELTIECKECEFNVSNLANNYPHTFLVQSFCKGIWSPFSSEDYATFTPTGTIKPVNPTYISDGINHVKLTWGPVPGAERYCVAKMNSGGSFSTFSYNVQDCNYDLYIRGGETYKFLIQVFIKGKWSAYTSEDLFNVTPKNDPERPKTSIVNVGPGTVTLSWNTISSASKYAIAEKCSDGSYLTYTYDCKDCSYKIPGIPGGFHYFLVQAWVVDHWSGYNDGDLLEVYIPSQGKVNIMSPARTYADQIVRYFNSKGHSYPSWVYSSRGAASINVFAQICVEEATSEDVDPAVLFCQAMHETGWLQFGGLVSPEQCNFGGLGATGPGHPGESFPDVRTGLKAQVQHLKAYACTLPIKNPPIVDKRFDRVTRGCAPCVTDLNGKWAVPGKGYGEAIVGLMNELFAS